MHSENEKDPTQTLNSACFQYFNYKLLVIITSYGEHIRFFENMKYGFCCIIVDKFHVENEKDLPNRFPPAHTFLYLAANYR